MEYLIETQVPMTLLEVTQAIQKSYTTQDVKFFSGSVGTARDLKGMRDCIFVGSPNLGMITGTVYYTVLKEKDGCNPETGKCTRFSIDTMSESDTNLETALLKLTEMNQNFRLI